MWDFRKISNEQKEKQQSTKKLLTVPYGAGATQAKEPKKMATISLWSAISN